MPKHNSHDEQTMEQIANMVGQAAGQLCSLYGQCELHTAMTLIRVTVEAIEAGCAEHDKNGLSAEARTEEVRAELSGMLRGLANIIKPEGEHNVQDTINSHRPH